MDHLHFDCERIYIEQISHVAQRNMLIQLYCHDNFGSFNLVDFYYRAINENAILMFLILIALYPVLFMCIAYIAEKYLSIGMQNISERFHLSPTLAAVTLIAFANGAPDVLSNLSKANKVNGELISLGKSYGSFIFSATLVLSNVVWNTAGDIKLPKLATIKELGFYLLSMLVVLIFGFIKKTGYLFISVYLGLYFVYIIVTLSLENYEVTEEPAHIDVPLDTEKIVEDEHAAKDRRDDEEINSQNIEIKEEPMTEVKEEPVTEIKEGTDDNKQQENSKNFFAQVIEEAFGEGGDTLERIIIPPLVFLSMLTISYINNPLMKIHTKHLIAGFSVVWTIYILGSAEFGLVTYIIICLIIAILSLVLDLTGLNYNVMTSIYEIISIFAAIGWISLFSHIIIDFIGFLAFYFNINEVILSSILLSAGNCIGDYFGNGALAKAGASVMGAMASYSGQIFNTFIGFSIKILVGLGTTDEFDLFALDRNKNAKPGFERPVPLVNMFIIFVILCTVSIIIVTLIYLVFSNFTLKKPFTWVLTGFYGVFFSIAILFGYLSSSM